MGKYKKVFFSLSLEVDELVLLDALAAADDRTRKNMAEVLLLWAVHQPDVCERMTKWLRSRRDDLKQYEPTSTAR